MFDLTIEQHVKREVADNELVDFMKEIHFSLKIIKETLEEMKKAKVEENND